MPLTEASLKAAIKAALNDTEAAAKEELDAKDVLAAKLAKAIIDELKENAVVIGTCPPTGGPLTGGRIT